jgi:hypothetical protein
MRCSIEYAWVAEKMDQRWALLCVDDMGVCSIAQRGGIFKSRDLFIYFYFGCRQALSGGYRRPSFLIAGRLNIRTSLPIWACLVAECQSQC